jgi:hypothetical protein
MAPGNETQTGGQGQRRRAPRRRLLKHVQVLSLDKKAASAVDLTLRNTSNSGAQLFGPGESLERVPDEFYLVVPGQLRMIRCKVVWKGQDAIGVSFLSGPGPLASQAPGAEADPSGEEYYLDRTTGAVVRRQD